MDKRRTFSREFKLAAVKKVTEQGLSYTAVARETAHEAIKEHAVAAALRCASVERTRTI